MTRPLRETPTSRRTRRRSRASGGSRTRCCARRLVRHGRDLGHGLVRGGGAETHHARPFPRARQDARFLHRSPPPLHPVAHLPPVRPQGPRGSGASIPARSSAVVDITASSTATVAQSSRALSSPRSLSTARESRGRRLAGSVCRGAGRLPGVRRHARKEHLCSGRYVGRPGSNGFQKRSKNPSVLWGRVDRGIRGRRFAANLREGDPRSAEDRFPC